MDLSLHAHERLTLFTGDYFAYELCVIAHTPLILTPKGASFSNIW